MLTPLQQLMLPRIVELLERAKMRNAGRAVALTAAGMVAEEAELDDAPAAADSLKERLGQHHGGPLLYGLVQIKCLVKVAGKPPRYSLPK